MRWLICYDISDNKNRRKAARFLEEKAIRVQESVFVADLLTEEVKSIKEWFKSCIHLNDDGTESIQIYPLCNNCWHKSWILGSVLGLEPVIVL